MWLSKITVADSGGSEMRGRGYTRRWLLVTALMLMAFIAGLLVSGPRRSNEPCDAHFAGPFVTGARLKAYMDCREDRQDAALKRLEARLASASASPSASPAGETTHDRKPNAARRSRPNAANTGVPAGTTLSSYTGPTTITTAGTVIDSKKITGCLNIKADNVTIKNSLIQSGGCFFNVLSDNGNTGLKLTDVEIDGQGNTSGDSAINGSNFSCLRCDLHGTVDGAKAGSNVVIQDSYIHDLSMTSGSHNDGIQSLGTTSLRIVHNTIIIKAGSTSAIILST
ncbi:hypothetical protein, partial [Microlunatus panaciterrae]